MSRLALTSGMLMVWLGAGLVMAQDRQGRTYGEGVSSRPAVSVRALLERPRQYVGQTVRVEGVVSAVCGHMGCWLEISDPDLGRGVRFKVRDGVIVFPKDAVGRHASAEGVFEEIATSPVRESHGSHQGAAQASGVPRADSATETLYWVRARGAVLHE